VLITVSETMAIIYKSTWTDIYKLTLSGSNDSKPKTIAIIYKLTFSGRNDSKPNISEYRVTNQSILTMIKPEIGGYHFVVRR
jgi:hypothetical protein